MTIVLRPVRRCKRCGDVCDPWHGGYCGECHKEIVDMSPPRDNAPQGPIGRLGWPPPNNPWDKFWNRT